MTAETISLEQALDLFEENISEIAKIEAEALAVVPAPKSKDYWRFWVESKLYLLWCAEIRQRYAPLRWALKHRQDKKDGKPVPEKIDVTAARAYPLERILPTPLIKNWARCPLHNEKTPSFHVRKNNTFVCYGCNAHGDSIDLYMKIHNVDFKTAVKALS